MADTQAPPTIDVDSLDAFTRAYLEALLWADAGPDQLPPGIDERGPEHIDPDNLARAVEDCRAFQAAYRKLWAGVQLTADISTPDARAGLAAGAAQQPTTKNPRPGVAGPTGGEYADDGVPHTRPTSQEDAMDVCLWRVTGDWAEWQQLTGETMTREQYEAMLEHAAGIAREMGHEVKYTEMTAREMRAALERAGWPNDQPSRAAIVAGGAPGNVRDGAIEPIGDDGIPGAVKRSLEHHPEGDNE